MLLAEIVDTSTAVAATRSRKAKVAALAETLARAEPHEVVTVAAYLAGSLRQRRTGLGWRGLQQLPQPADAPSLTAVEVDAAFAELAGVSGAGSKAARERLVTDLFGRATPDEQAYLRGLVTGELRQGALDALVLDAVAAAAEVPADAVRRAAMFAGSTLPVAVAALTEGTDALDRFGLQPGRPVRPMLASSANDVDEAMAKAGAGEAVAVDSKLDGIRIQVHKYDGRVRVFTRSLEDITDRVPEVEEVVAGLPASTLVLDGEAIALGPDGRPRPFQETGARTASHVDVATLRAQVPLTSYFFDVLHIDGGDLVDRPARERFERLAALLPDPLVVPRTVTADHDQAKKLLARVVSSGHEGVVVKSLDAPYDAGRRGAAWVKVKPRHTLDLVVLAVEWGSGRRQGWLSNIHLGARDPDTGGFVMLGKTFKGMTDELLAWQTKRLQELEVSRDGHTVYVRPELVVEVAFNDLQASPQYPGGLALRFARVKGYRPDKRPADADTLSTLQQIWRRQTGLEPPATRPGI